MLKIRLKLGQWQFLGSFLFLFLLGCASNPKHPAELDDSSAISANEEYRESEDIFGPPSGGAAKTTGPEVAHLPHAIVLVLGPGMARGFAYSGVFTALHNLKIPVAAVLGTEIGALIGALYVTSPNLNQFEWRLLRFKEDVFQSDNGFIARMQRKAFVGAPNESDGKKLDQRLKEIFQNQRLEASPILFRASVLSKDLGVPMVLNHGSFAEVIRAAMAVPGVIAPAELMGPTGVVKIISADSTRPFLVTEAHKLNLGPVIVIDVIRETDTSVISDELKQADLVIRPNIVGISYNDFKKRTDAAFQGKLAVTQAAAEIHRVMAAFHPRTNAETHSSDRSN